MGFFKLFVVVVAIELAIFLVGYADEYLRSTIKMYHDYVPLFWWPTEIWAEMHTNQQHFMDSLPEPMRVIWTPVTIFVATIILKIIPGKY